MRGDGALNSRSGLAPLPRGMIRSIVHDGSRDMLTFLNDCAIAMHGGRLYAAWYNSTDAEICGSSLVRGRWSGDGGHTWSDVFRVAGEAGPNEEHFAPCSLFAHDGRLLALITEMSGKNMTVSLDLYEADDYTARRWRRLAAIGPGFICNAPPVMGANGNYIAGVWMPMKDDTPAFPAVLASQGGRVEKPWQCTLLYNPHAPGAPAFRCPEVGLSVDGGDVTAYVRNDVGKPGDSSGGPSYVFRSGDGGASWIGPFLNPLPIGNAKIFAGTLSDGRQYLIYNEDRGFFNRTLLKMAVKDRAYPSFQRFYTLFEYGADEFGGRGRNWFYPCACESDGFLYAVCTMEERNGIRSAAMAKIPLDSLT
jgi:hypothetical protein